LVRVKVMSSKTETMKALVDAISTISSLNQELNKLKMVNETLRILIKDLNEENTNLKIQLGIEQ